MTETIIFPDDLKVFEDKSTHYKYVNYPINYPSGVHGNLVILHNNKFVWQPSNDIESITIKFKENENTTVK